MRQNFKVKKVTVIGVGKLGLCFALTLEKSGYDVIGVDVHEVYINSINDKSFLSDETGVNDYLFHAGTIKKDEKIFATGGRVLNFVSLSDDFSASRNNVLKKLNKLNWSGGFYRNDIGYKVIK